MDKDLVIERLSSLSGRIISEVQIAAALDKSVDTVRRRLAAGCFEVDEYKAIAEAFGINHAKLLAELDVVSYGDMMDALESGGALVSNSDNETLLRELLCRETGRPAHWGQHVPYPEDDYDLAASEQPDDDDNTLHLP